MVAMTAGSVLCIDVGSGTQDVLYFRPGDSIENCPKFVLPTPARRIAQRIAQLTKRGVGVHLTGSNMGGGFFGALKAHMAAGLSASATPQAAKAVHDNPERVREWGIAIVERTPAGSIGVHLADYDPGYWEGVCAHVGLPTPDVALIAAQDHGYSPGESNRRTRFALWTDLLDTHDGDPVSLLYDEPPATFTRLAAIHAASGGGAVADSGAAAVLGALFDPTVEALQRETGVTVVNVGNSHTIAFLLYDGRIHGVYEQHTGIKDAEGLWADLAAFRRMELTFETVYEENGHGVMTRPSEAASRAGGFERTVVLGPQRALLQGYDASFPAPGGDMMLAGCFGLLSAWCARTGTPLPPRV